MAKRPLKVFRTSAGFEDVYVAAPSRKAALAAWGTDKDLFARQAAEEVHDPELIKAPLAQPGNVVRLPRGTTAEHLAAAGRAQKAKRRAAASATIEEITRAKKRRPKPSKAKLERARAGLERKADEYAASIAAIEAEIGALTRKRDTMRTDRDKELERLKRAVSKEHEAYSTALNEWEG